MVRLLTSGATGAASLRSAEVLNLGKLVPVVVDDFMPGNSRRPERLQESQLGRQNDDHRQQDGFRSPGQKDAAQGEQADGSLPGERGWRAPKGRPDRRPELLPRRRPFDQ